MRMYQGPPPAPGRLSIRPRRRGISYREIGRGHHPPLAWLPPIARLHHSSPSHYNPPPLVSHDASNTPASPVDSKLASLPALLSSPIHDPQESPIHDLEISNHSPRSPLCSATSLPFRGLSHQERCLNSASFVKLPTRDQNLPDVTVPPRPFSRNYYVDGINGDYNSPSNFTELTSANGHQFSIDANSDENHNLNEDRSFKKCVPIFSEKLGLSSDECCILDDEPSRGGAVRMQVTPNGRCPTEPQQAPLPLERLPTFQPSISAPKKDPVMEDLSFSSSSTDNSLNESNSNDDDSSDSSDSTSSDNEDNEDNDNEEDLKSPSNGEKEDQVEVKKEVIDDDQGKDSSNWKLGFLFRIDESEAKTSESRLTSSSGKAGVSKGRAAEQKANEARKSPTIHGVYGYDGSRLSEDSSDGEQIKSVVRPTPQVAPVPRTSDRQKSLLSSSDSSDENPVTPVKISKRELPTPKLPAAAGNKSKTAAKPKCNPRGRLRKTAHVILESKAKSKAYVSTDDSSSDSDDGGRPSKPLYKAALNRKPTPKKTASSTNKENLPRHSTTHTGNANTKQPTTSRVTKCQTSKSLSLVSAYRVRDSKPLNKKEQLIPPNAVPDLLFVFPENAIKKKIDKNQEKAEELTRVTNSRTSDANKKEVLLTLYAKNKDYNQNDPSNKSKDAKKRSRGQLVHSKEGNVSKISRPSKERDVQTPSQSLSENVEHLPTINAMETLCTSKRRREESNSGGTHPHKRSKNVLQNFSSEQDTEQPHVHRSTKNSRSSKRGSPRDSGSSRCQSRSSNHEDAPGPAMHSPASHQRSSRVPLEGESSVAFRCRQSNTLSCSSVVLPTTSTACSMPPAVVTPSSTPTVASSSVPPTASNPLDDHSRRSPASAVVRNSLLVPNDNPPNAPNEVRLSAGHYKPSLPAGFKKVIPQPISSVYPCIGALEGFSLEEKFFELFGVTEKKYQDRGKALKRIGDSEVDIIDRSVKYLEAFIFFALEGCALEQDPSTQKSAVPMFTQTIDLIRWVSSAFNNRKLSPPMSHKDFLVHCNPKLAVLCLFAQSLLSLKVYTIRSRELKESKNSLKKYCDTYDKRTSSNRTSQGGGSGGRGGSSNPTPACPSNPGGVGTGPTTASTPSGHSTTECRRAANSPSALSSTPSPAGSLNSESSTSSGYNTTPVTATPSPPQEPTTMIEVPQMEHEQLVRHYSVSDYLNNAVEMWAEAQKYIRENELETFFACLDAAVCPLSLHSSLDELVIYIKAGLREIERIRMHYSGAGDTAVPYAGGGRPGGRNISSESGTPSDPPVVNSQQ
ncbi:Transcription factor AF4/FMR2 [Trinorchestia longiramus]|nr:Transcription factor AF4/FMR2 [Trinorchestia longiramus]